MATKKQKTVIEMNPQRAASEYADIWEQIVSIAKVPPSKRQGWQLGQYMQWAIERQGIIDQIVWDHDEQYKRVWNESKADRAKSPGFEKFVVYARLNWATDPRPMYKAKRIELEEMVSICRQMIEEK